VNDPNDYVFGAYAFDLYELSEEIEDASASAWAREAAGNLRFRVLLRKEAEPQLDAETADDPLDVMGHGAADILKAAMLSIYERRAELPLELSDLQDPIPEVGTPGQLSRPSGLAERIQPPRSSQL